MGDVSTDSELLSGVRSGSDQAFAALYRRHSEAVVRHAHRVCRSGDADDIVSEFWERVWARPPESVSSFDGWMRMVIRREAWRRAVRWTDGSVHESVAGHGTTPTHHVARQQAVDLLEKARERGDLSTVEFSAIILDSEGWGAKQCAAADGVSRSAWSDRLARARKKLRRLALGEAEAGRRPR